MDDMNCQWIIENFTNESSYTDLIKAVRAAGHPLIEFKAKNGYTKDQISQFSQYHCVVFNGSIQMAKLIRRDLSLNCQPVIYANFEKYLCTAYYPHFGDMLFNDKYIMLPLKELKRLQLFAFGTLGTLGRDGMVFVRPDSGEKTFQAQLLDIIDIYRFIEQNRDVENDLVVVSTPKNIKWEGRFVCAPNEVIASSTYRFQGQRSYIRAVPKEATEFCQEVLKVGYNPDEVFCVDLAQGDDDKYYLLELTSFSSAGLYEADKDKIVKRVSEIALNNFKK